MNADTRTREGVGAGRARDLWIAGAWGFAEAVFFFIVPDVWLSRVALRSWRRALAASLAATAGALAGGALVHALGARLGGTVLEWIDRLPAVSAAMIEAAGLELSDGPLRALIRGMTSGTPYKIYAAEAGIQDIPLAPFLAASAVARMLRFVAVGGGVALASAAIRRLGGSGVLVQWLHAAGWAAFYAWFFASMPG